MHIPNAPDVMPLQQLSPSIYEALLRCRARATWAAFGDRSTLPQHPKALLGSCLHGLVWFFSELSRHFWAELEARIRPPFPGSWEEGFGIDAFLSGAVGPVPGAAGAPAGPTHPGRYAAAAG